MGILDNKSRVFDFILTDIGKSQLANGKLVIEHASLTDRHTFYEHDVVSGSSDATSRIYFEAATTPGDTITFETDDSGQLVTYTSGDLQLDSDGQIISGSSPVTGSLTNVDQFASMTNTLLSSSLDNFKNLQLISTSNVFNDEDFEISNKEIVFNLEDAIQVVDSSDHFITPIPSNTQPVKLQTQGVLPVFYNWRLGGAENFKFLPPVNSSGPEDFTFEYIEDYGSETLGAGEVQTSEFDASTTVSAQTGVPLRLPFRISIKGSPDAFSNRSQELTARGQRLMQMNRSNKVPMDVSTTGDPIIRHAPDGRRLLGLYKPVIFLPDLTNPQKLRDTVHNYIAHGVPAIPSANFSTIDRDVSDTNYGAFVKAVSNKGYTTSGDFTYVPGLPCNGVMLPFSAQSVSDTDSKDDLQALNVAAPSSDGEGIPNVTCVQKSLDNNLLIQFFESNPETGTMTKLDLIDAGETKDILRVNSPSAGPQDNRVFFVGKIFIDAGVPRFVNLFTIIMRKTFQDPR